MQSVIIWSLATKTNMLIDYLANRKLLNNNVAGKSIKKEHFLAGNVRLWGKRKHHFRLIDNPLFCVSLFAPIPSLLT